jgi:hypothetical protein
VQLRARAVMRVPHRFGVDDETGRQAVRAMLAKAV